jgi:hypothetical protein
MCPYTGTDYRRHGLDLFETKGREESEPALQNLFEAQCPFSWSWHQIKGLLCRIYRQCTPGSALHFPIPSTLVEREITCFWYFATQEAHA